MERYNLNTIPNASSEAAGVLRVANSVDEKNCGCADAAVTPSNLYKLSDCRIANTTYKQGDTVAVPYRATLFMECIVAGTTDSSPLDTTNAYDGQQIVDGGVTWEVGVIGAIPGALIPYTGDTPPAGTVDSSGGAVSRTTYARLFRIFGTKYGAGDGSTTFNLPNLNNGSFAEGSTTVGTVKSAGLPNITASIELRPVLSGSSGSGSLFEIISGAFERDYSYKWSDWTRLTVTGSNNNTGHTLDFNANRSNSIYGNANTVQPKSVTVKYCIKY